MKALILNYIIDLMCFYNRMSIMVLSCSFCPCFWKENINNKIVGLNDCKMAIAN